jgi:hypothetical protein
MRTKDPTTIGSINNLKLNQNIMIQAKIGNEKSSAMNWKAVGFISETTSDFL